MPPMKELGPGIERAVSGKPAVAAGELKVEEEARFEEENPPLALENKDSEPQEMVYAEEKVVRDDEDSSTKKDENTEKPGDYSDNDERLDFEDNEPEEYGGVESDDREIDQDSQEEGDKVEDMEIDQDSQEEGDKVEEESNETGRDEEEEGDVVEEEMEDLGEEPEPEGNIGLNVHEVEEHHEFIKERRKRMEFEVFVGGLGEDVTENDLRKVFSEVGEITDVRLMMNPQTKKSKGFAFLRFATVEQALRARMELKTAVVNGKKCGVSPCMDSDTVFLGNICKTWTKENLKEKLKDYGVHNTEDLTLIEDSKNVGMNRGFALMEFSSRPNALNAIKRLKTKDVMFGVDTPAIVSLSDSYIDPGGEIMDQVKTVFLDGLSVSWDEDLVKELLKRFGKIEKVKLARNMPAARRKDFGFVTFETHEAAVICAKSINNEELGEGYNKVKVRARLSRPLEKGKRQHATHGDVWPAHGSSRGLRSTRSRPVPHGIPLRGPIGIGPRLPLVPELVFKNPAIIRDRRRRMVDPPRTRPAPPLPRFFDRRSRVPAYPSSVFRDYSHREELPPRSRVSIDYSIRDPLDKHPSSRDGYSHCGSGYSNVPRGGTLRSTERRAYADDCYSQRYERPPSYREGHVREFDSISGSKRSYSSLDDGPPRHGEVGSRNSRPRLDCDLGSSASHYNDAYNDRIGRSNLGYRSRSFLSTQDSHGLYSSSQDMSYRRGSYGGGNDGGMYSSRFGGDYMSCGGDVGSIPYSSRYASRGSGGNSYMGSGNSGSHRHTTERVNREET